MIHIAGDNKISDEEWQAFYEACQKPDLSPRNPSVTCMACAETLGEELVSSP